MQATISFTLFSLGLTGSTGNVFFDAEDDFDKGSIHTHSDSDDDDVDDVGDDDDINDGEGK